MAQSKDCRTVSAKNGRMAAIFISEISRLAISASAIVTAAILQTRHPAIV
jgi:hypothetical protein